jgi:hypothetical protein
MLGKLGQLVSGMRTKFVDRHDENSPILGLTECSPPDLVQDSIVSSKETSKFSRGCGEVDNLLNDVRMYAS